MTSKARLDLKRVNALCGNFPKGKWVQLAVKNLYDADRGKFDWGKLKNVGGNYAFLLPRKKFNEEKRIRLHAPTKRKIDFYFSHKGHPTAKDQFVVYVGKTTDLKRRIQWHFGLAKKNSGAQVQKGLNNSQIAKNRKLAVDLMIKEATIVYLILPGDKEAANRDLLEVSLIAKFAPPFNVKSER